MAAYVIYPTEEQEKFMKAFLEALEISFIKDDEYELPPHVLARMPVEKLIWKQEGLLHLKHLKRNL